MRKQANYFNMGESQRSKIDSQVNEKQGKREQSR